ncbi:uncharacterized protein LOC106658253 [Trichogramma pretiosum]|uniref:uncharacterized protein LOC106658253 n=1 Tax=Trichogramma pretiosum TaxID=7493 RepID=UPI0006C9CB1D|nr:uncharacterized protein LOC106658253 [Trichogramma pretiosum]
MKSSVLEQRRTRSSHNLRRSKLFSLYAKIFRLLLGKFESKDGFDENAELVDDYSRELDALVLPSNEDWRLRVYYSLVELQRENDRALAVAALHDIPYEELQQLETFDLFRYTQAATMSEAQQSAARQGRQQIVEAALKRWDWEPSATTAYPLTPRSSRKLDADSSTSIMLKASAEPGWRLRDILLASRLLIERCDQPYSDEAETRRVFGLVYDVLRYKPILNRALDDVGFWLRHGELKERERVVWLLLYDMQGRKFAKPVGSAALALRNEALREAGLLEIEQALQDTKTRLAASLSRLRIGGSALNLDELLPAHLRTAEGVTWGDEGAIASGWVNSSKLPTRYQFVEEMRKIGLSLSHNCSANSELHEYQYVFDPLCPKVVNLHEKAREKLAVSQLVTKHAFVFLDRSLCVGAAALTQAMRAGKLCGPVILTHCLAPRHVGYLAELLRDVEDAGRLLVFGLGEARDAQQGYLERALGLGPERCKLYAEGYAQAPTTPEMERATIVLAVPPCSYSGVRDVVDLAIARGGDLELLESLTNLEAESALQPQAHLAEQMATLRHALTRPNVQMLVYEAHTLLPSETTEMIEQAVEHANRLAKDKFLRERPLKKKSKLREHPTVKPKSAKRMSVMSIDNTSKSLDESAKSEDENTENSTSSTNATIPESDLFEMWPLSQLYEKDCSRLIDQGSFVLIVKRKEMMQFNSLFMIKVAEAKGVFGESSKQRQQPSPPPKTPDSQMANNAKHSRSKSNRKSKKLLKQQFERLTAPTHASIARLVSVTASCPRHQQHLEHEEQLLQEQVREARRHDARRWWSDLGHSWRFSDEYNFRALRTDPRTRKLLFPAHVTRLVYNDQDDQQQRRRDDALYPTNDRFNADELRLTFP